MPQLVWIQIIATVAILCIALAEALVLQHRKPCSFDWSEAWLSVADMAGRRLLALLPIGIATPVFAWVWNYRLFTIELSGFATFILLFLGLEFFYYWYHRASHRIRFFWATHAVHHSTKQLTLSTSFRLGWTNKLTGTTLFYTPLVYLGFDPKVVLTALSLNLLYQFWLHTTFISKLGWLEWILNTPSAHRVHHASNLDYLDANYGGVLIIFDRLFGTYRPERVEEPCIFGLVKPMRTRNVLTMEFSQWADLYRDMRQAPNLVSALALLVKPPGWSPDGKSLTTEDALQGTRSAPAAAMLKVLSALALGLALCAPAVAQDKRPNILVVLFDDAGFMDFGAYGSDTRTPTIDALAKKGVMLSRFYASPFCGPSRSMLMTGMDNHQVGMGTLVETVTKEARGHPGYSMRWNKGQTTIASLLAKAGYQTYVTGKWGIGETGANLPNRFGFDRSYVMDATGGSNYDRSHYLLGYDQVDWFENGKPISLPGNFYSSRHLVDKMIEYVEAGKPDKPFFAYLSLQAVHIPVQVPRPYIDAYNGVFDEGWDLMRVKRLQRAIDIGLVPPTAKLAPSPKTHRAWASLSAKEQAVAARYMQVNAGMITAADEHLGRLLAHLKSTGKLDNTIVIVTSDNGAEGADYDFKGLQKVAMSGIELIEGFDTSPENAGQKASLTAIGPEWASVSSAPFNLYKFYTSEGGLRVPMVMAGPGIAAAGITDVPVHVADLVPTMLDAAGVAYDKSSFYGRSAYPFLTGQTKASRAEGEGFGFEVSGNAALYRGKWKITRLAPSLGDTAWRLYDISADPGETTDVSANNPELFESMKAEYRSYAEKVGVVELASGDFAFKQLSKNLAAKVINKYWPYALGVILVFAALLCLAFWLARGLMRQGRVRV